MPRFPFRSLFSRPRLLVVDRGASHVACAVFSRGTGGRLRLERYSEETHDPAPASASVWRELTERTLRAIAVREKLAGPCRLALPGHQTLVKFLCVPCAEKAGRTHVIEFEAQQSMPCSLGELVWDHWCIADSGVEIEVVLGAAKRDVLQGTVDSINGVGLQTEQALPSALALLRAFQYCHSEANGEVAVIGIGARSTHFLYVRGARFFMRTLAFGGNAVTQLVADELKIEFTAAEALKLRVCSGRTALENAAADAAVGRAIAAFVSRLQIEFTRTTLSHCRQHDSLFPTLLYLGGGGSLIPELPSILANKLDLQVVRFDPSRRLEILPAAFEGKFPARFPAELVGLAAGLVRTAPPVLNLLPSTQIAATKTRNRRRGWLATCLLFGLTPLLPILYYSRHLDDLEAQAASIETRAQSLRVLAQQNATALAHLGEFTGRIAALRPAVQAKFSWIEFLADLQNCLARVGDAWLERLQVTRSAGSSGVGKPNDPRLRVVLSGRLLDTEHPVSKVSSESYQRATELLRLFGQLHFVHAVENERFDNTQSGILRFDCTLVIKPGWPL
jgi:type IV pilus assembly protein PilM